MPSHGHWISKKHYNVRRFAFHTHLSSLFVSSARMGMTKFHFKILPPLLDSSALSLRQTLPILFQKKWDSKWNRIGNYEVFLCNFLGF